MQLDPGYLGPQGIITSGVFPGGKRTTGTTSFKRKAANTKICILFVNGSTQLKVSYLQLNTIGKLGKFRGVLLFFVD